ncbi:type II secretion system protein M [Myxococcota bacterium]|nr:type II secretion system protein M [Myxococcota bacterium]MBU1534674.1 type II secretion system protein M [Myxococcota bacterium]
MKLFNKIEEMYDNFTEREQRMVVASVFVTLVFIAAFFVFLISSSFTEREDRVRELKSAARLLEQNKESVESSRQALASYEMKATKKPPMLQGHLDELAKSFELGSASYTPKKSEDLGANKEYLMESVEVKFFDVGLKKITQFMDKLEKGPNLIMVTELRITTRRNQHDRLDPTIVVASYYKRSAAELKELAKKSQKTKKKGKGKQK